MTQPLKALVTKPGDPSLIPGTHTVEEEGKKGSCSLTLIHATRHIDPTPSAPMHM